MAQEQHSIHYERFTDISELPKPWQELVQAARKATTDAYAPYSNFHVAAAAKTGDTIVTTTNQENASFPVGLCAERTMLSVLSTQYAGQKIDAIAISYHNINSTGGIDKPIAPCGLCRQSMLEFEQRNGGKINIIMSSLQGEIIVVHSVEDLLPFSFSASHLD